MRLGISSYAYGWAVGVAGHLPATPFREHDLLSIAREHDLRTVQLGDHLSLHDWNPARKTQFTESAWADKPIEIEIGARGLTESNLQTYIELGKSMRSRILRFVIDEARYEPRVETIVGLLRDVIPLLRDANLTLAVENHDRFSARTLRQIIENTGSERVGICLDTANSFGAGEGLEHILTHLAPLTVNLHIKDYSIGRISSGMGFTIEGRPAGRGCLDALALLEAIAQHGRCETAILETWTPPEATLADTIAKERRWVEMSLLHLKPLFSNS